ncbi:MAG: shikimate kinase [Deltaproteobacteria bacterium]|nr:shikimate kinase [Deltaproteobacteria bacterium]
MGRSLASTLRRTFVDTDCELSEQVGMTISEYVRKMGWAAFRELERSILQQISKQDMQVVATGGGVVMDSRNADSMRNSGTLVWLKASPQTIRARLSKDQSTAQTRPALSSKGAIEEIEDILSERMPYYEQATDLSIDTDGLSIEQICSQLLTYLSKNK